MIEIMRQAFGNGSSIDQLIQPVRVTPYPNLNQQDRQLSALRHVQRGVFRFAPIHHWR